MKGLHVGYVMAMTAMLSLLVAVGIAAFYPAPKIAERPKYPSLSLDYNSPDYQAQQKQYQQESQVYEQKSKGTATQRKVWGQNTFAVTLVAGIVMLVLGMLLAKPSGLVSKSLLSSSFIVVVFGAALATYHAEGSISSIFGVDTTFDLSKYKFMQFAILLIGSAAGLVLGFMGMLEEKTMASSRPVQAPAAEGGSL